MCNCFPEDLHLKPWFACCHLCLPEDISETPQKCLICHGFRSYFCLFGPDMGPATRCPEVFGQLETTVEATVDQQEWKNRSYWGFPRANVGKRLSALLCLLKPGRDERGACRALAAGWWDHEDRLHFSSFSLKINPAKLVQNICRDHLHEAHWFLATRSHTHTRPPCNSPVHLAWRCLPPVTPSRWSQQINSAKIAGKSDARDIQSDRFPHAHWFWCLPICPIWSKSWYQKPNSIQVVSGNWSCLKVGCLIIILPIHFQAKPIELGDSL